MRCSTRLQSDGKTPCHTVTPGQKPPANILRRGQLWAVSAIIAPGLK